MLPLWLKAFHLIFMTCWFAGLFYLPRLFVYHALSEDKTSRDRFKIMERKLYWGIMTPSALLTLTFGLGVIHSNLGYYSGLLWLKYKLALVLLLVCYHIYCGLCLRRFAQDNNTHSPVFYRVLNELPVFLLIGIVLLAILKPFSG
jgi:putative membrane protein